MDGHRVRSALTRLINFNLENGIGIRINLTGNDVLGESPLSSDSDDSDSSEESTEQDIPIVYSRSPNLETYPGFDPAVFAANVAADLQRHQGMTIPGRSILSHNIASIRLYPSSAMNTDFAGIRIPDSNITSVNLADYPFDDEIAADDNRGRGAVDSEGPAVSNEGSAVNAEGTAVNAEGTAANAEGTEANAEGTEANAEGTAANTEDTAVSTEGTAVSAEGIAGNTENTAVNAEGRTDENKDTVSKGSTKELPKEKGKKRKKESGEEEPSDGDDDLSGQTCSICMDDWSNSGAHRLCCLKCGHTYGESCIRRWLTSASVSSGRCPQCNAKAKIRDIRPLFARSLRAIDTAERDRIAAQLEKTRREKERLQMDITRLTMTNQMQQAEMRRLQTELDQLIRAKGNAVTAQQNQPPTTFEPISQDGLPCQFSLMSSLDFSREGECRVLAFSESLNLMVISQRSTNPLFPGYGVKKVDTLEFRATQFVPAHQKLIRDLAFSPSSRSLLLSAAFDCTARLLDVGSGSNAVVATFSAESPLWSCCWDAVDSNLLHVGSQGGMILTFDIRSTSSPVSRKSDPDDITPVAALVPIPPSAGRVLPNGGLVTCHLSTCWSRDSSTDECHSLPFDGPFTSLRYEPSTQHFLISSRPCARAPHARHHLCERSFLRPGEDNDRAAVCNGPIHTFLGGTTQKVMSRPCLVPVGRDLLVAAHQESSSTVALWSAGRGGRVATIPASDTVIDACPLIANRETHVALLSEKILRMYKIH